MKIYSLAVVLSPPSGPSAILSQASDLSSFSFYQKGSVGEFMTFFTKTVAERTSQGQRQTVQENNYTAHVYNRGGAEQLSGAYIVMLWPFDQLTLLYRESHLCMFQPSLSLIWSTRPDLHFPFSRRSSTNSLPKFPSPPSRTPPLSRSPTSTRTSRNTRTLGRQIIL